MWTKEQRLIYRREGDGYPSDLRDAESARLEPMIPPARRGGRPRKIDIRAAMNAILYLLRTGRPRATCRATAFRRARRSTPSFACSSFVTLASIQLALRGLAREEVNKRRSWRAGPVADSE